MDEDKSPPFYAEDLVDEEIDLVEHEPISISPVSLQKVFLSDLTSSGSFNLDKIGNDILNRLLEALPLPLILVDNSGAIIAMNSAGSSLAGKSFSSLFPFAEDVQKAAEILESVWIARSPQTAEAMVKIGTQRFWARMHLRSMRIQRQRLVLVLLEDITAQKSRAFLNEKYRKLVQMFPMGIAEFRFVQELEAGDTPESLLNAVAEASLVGGNLEYAEMHHYSNVSEAKGLPFRSFAAFMDDCKDQITAWAASGFGRKSLESVEMASNGEIKHFENTLVGNLQENRAIGFWTTRRDTSEEHRKNEAIRSSEQMLRKIFDENSLGMAVLSRDGLIQRANQTLCRMLGYSLQELIGKPMNAMSHPQDREQEVDLSQRLWTRQIESYKCVKRLKTKNRRTVQVNATCFAINDGNDRPTHCVIMLEDTTAQRNAQERVNLLSAAVEQSSEGIYVTDLKGQVVFANHAIARLLQSSPEELIGKHVAFFHPASDMLTLVAAKRRLLHAGEFDGEMTYVRKDGNVFPGLLHSTLILDELGNPTALIHAVRDISEFKTTERALRANSEKLAQYSHSLETKVGEGTKTLEDNRRKIQICEGQLKKAEEALKVLIAGVEEQKKSAEKKIIENIRAAMNPIMNRLKTENLPDRIKEVVDLLDGTLDSVGSPTPNPIADKSHLLTLREIRICEMINSGLTSKEVAKILGVSPHTIFLHRAKIRKKLGLTGNEDDLASYLGTVRKKKA